MVPVLISVLVDRFETGPLLSVLTKLIPTINIHRPHLLVLFLSFFLDFHHLRFKIINLCLTVNNSFLLICCLYFVLFFHTIAGLPQFGLDVSAQVSLLCSLAEDGEKRFCWLEESAIRMNFAKMSRLFLLSLIFKLLCRMGLWAATLGLL